jgi:Tfp pilus assembly protein PilN
MISEKLKWDFKNSRIFSRVVKYALIFFIALLLCNFLVYNHYHGDVGSLNEVLAATSSQKDQLTLLEESVIRKKERVETLSASSNSKATYYLDLFAQKIPKSILLNEIKYQPLAKPVREEKPIILEEEVLLVSGISKNADAFSFWIEDLEKQDWVNSVETLDYNFVSRTTSDFLIEIKFDAAR